MCRRIMLSKPQTGFESQYDAADQRIVGILILLNAAREARKGRCCLLDVANALPQFNGVFKKQLVPVKEYYFQYFD